jgi:vacuolar-type H+-ATPase subunit C/Vma6
MSSLIKYSAVTAKVRAMEGKRLTPAQWQQMARVKNLYGVWELLSRCPAWAAVGEEPTGAQDGAVLTQSLWTQLERDQRNLSHYLDKADGQRTALFLRQRQGDASLSPEEYQRLWSQSGKALDGSKAVAGAEADAMNLVYILRLRQFPATVGKAKQLLIPLRKDLTPALVDKLLAARDDESVLAVLQTTRWGETFTSLEPGALERAYRAYMESFCRHIIAGASPGLAQVQAFLTLKDLERQRLTRLVAAVQRGLDPALVF